MLLVDDHPLLDLHGFITEFSSSLGDLATPESIERLLCGTAPAPLASDDRVRAAVRDLLRHDGFKPTGRSKPSPEYLLKAAEDGRLSPINLAVDLGNAVSLHSGLPISVVDFALLQPPFRVSLAASDSEYRFNQSGQTIQVGHLLCLCDAEGPCANGVKDAQRTKTHAVTRKTLTLIWGTRQLPGRTIATATWYCQLLADAGIGTTKPIWPT